MTSVINQKYQPYQEKKILALMKKKLSPIELELYIESFSWYFKYDANKDFVIDLDMHWKRLGYSAKVRAVEAIEKYFDENTDYSHECSDVNLLTLHIYNHH
jgi:hypothetical protein